MEISITDLKHNSYNAFLLTNLSHNIDIEILKSAATHKTITPSILKDDHLNQGIYCYEPEKDSYIFHKNPEPSKCSIVGTYDGILYNFNEGTSQYLYSYLNDVYPSIDYDHPYFQWVIFSKKFDWTKDIIKTRNIYKKICEGKIPKLYPQTADNMNIFKMNIFKLAQNIRLMKEGNHPKSPRKVSLYDSHYFGIGCCMYVLACNYVGIDKINADILYYVE